MPRLFVVGAGFSAPAGLPLAGGLLDLVLTELEATHGRPNHLHRALDEYRSFLDSTEGEIPDTIDSEKFAEFLDYRHFLGLMGSDTWAEEGNRDQYLLRWGIGRVIHRNTPAMPPDLYMEFASRLQPRDVILSFNYDMLIERSLAEQGKSFRRFPTRFSEVFMTHSTVDSESEKGEILISKLHGSIDWVSRRSFDRTQDLYRRWGDFETADFSYRRDPLFGPEPIMPTVPLVEGPRPDEDPLSFVEQITDLDTYYTDPGIAYSHPPLVLPPSRAKQLYGDSLRPFWEGMGRLGWAWGGLNIVGYSLPEDDTYARQALWELASGYEKALSDPDWRIQDVNRIAIVDLRCDTASKDQLLRVYRFLPRDYTDFVTTGFDKSALATLFPDKPFGRSRVHGDRDDDV